MYREYDLFEKFPDGSSVWRASALGLEGTRLHLRDLAQKSENQFYAINIASGKIIYPDLRPVEFDLLAPGGLENEAEQLSPSEPRLGQNTTPDIG